MAAIATGPGGAVSALPIKAALTGLSPRSPLIGSAGTFDLASRKYNLDWRLLVAIAGAETSFGTYGPSQGIKNPFGMGPGIRYSSWDNAIMAAAKNLRENYLDQGLTTVAKIQGKWAPGGAANDPTGLNSNWTRNVTAYMTRMGGNPDKLNRTEDDSTLGGIKTIPGDAAGVVSDAAGAVSSPFAGVVDLIGRVFSLGTWLRVLSVVGGVAAILVALFVIFRTQARGRR